MPAAENTHTRTYRIEALPAFNGLDPRQARYAHHLARACWHGTRIMLRQTSPESEGIYDFILELHRACDGKWDVLDATPADMEAWLEFAGLFLSSLGNRYAADGDRKITPDLSRQALRRLASISPAAISMLDDVLEPMLAPGSESGYYLGDGEPITNEAIKAVTNLMETRNIAPENTRLRMITGNDVVAFEILQASAERDIAPQLIGEVTIDGDRRAEVFLRRGDHAQEMAQICAELTEASKHAATGEQKAALGLLVESFRTGDYEAFPAAQRVWVQDRAPVVEHCMGFLFGYRDPYGARAEWQAIAGTAHRGETEQMGKLVAMAGDLTRTLPWAVVGVNDGKGPFEPAGLAVRDFAIIHVLASVSSTVWEATNLTIEDKGCTFGVKSMVFGNRTCLNSKPDRPCHYVHPSEANAYMASAHIVRSIGTAIHELIGHGTGKLLTEIAPGEFNFTSPVISPVTGQTINTWYRSGQTYETVFGDLARTVEECRAFLVASYIADNRQILSLFSYDEHSSPTADELIYYTYLHIGVEGLRALRSFNSKERVWCGDHDRAQFAILKHLVQDGGGVISIDVNKKTDELYIRVDRSKILSLGKPSLGRMLCKIHIWHCTADIAACRPYYEDLSAVPEDSEFEVWRKIAAGKPEPRWKFVQPNTFLRKDGTVELRQYEESNEGIILSFFEREV
ncbi:dipeptidyl-peptidase 3 [Naviculisporaceae sp. PSN 640]